MRFCITNSKKLFNSLKSHFFVRLILCLIISLLLLYISSVCYYFVYCVNRFHQGLVEANNRHLWTINHGVQETFMPILMPVCDRPHYLKRVLDGLSKVDGINETLIVVSQDCAQSSITSILLSVFAHLRILILPHTPPYFALPGYVHNNEYATSANVKFLLQFAFEHMLADGAILLESDLIPSVDFYRYHQWTYRTLLAPNTSNILSIHTFNIDSTNSSDPYSLFPRGFDSWGWSTARTRWLWLKQQWTRYNGWDSIVSKTAKRDGWKCMIPKLSRTRMIGLKGINVNVIKELERKQFEENMYMSEKKIEYERKTPNILSV